MGSGQGMTLWVVQRLRRARRRMLRKMRRRALKRVLRRKLWLQSAEDGRPRLERRLLSQPRKQVKLALIQQQRKAATRRHESSKQWHLDVRGGQWVKQRKAVAHGRERGTLGRAGLIITATTQWKPITPKL